jgi:hypothetical protein
LIALVAAVIVSWMLGAFTVGSFRGGRQQQLNGVFGFICYCQLSLG